MMTYDAIAALPLAAAEPDGPLSVLTSQILLWGRVALGIGLVIFVHELGHFVAAKLFGVKCEKFYVGFDVPIRIGPIKFPRTLGKFQYGETEYGIGILPLGGYVKMLGQDDDPRKAEQEAERIRVGGGDEDEPEQLDPRSYPAKPVWQRMIIISAGVVMNVITGVLFAAIAYGYGVNYTPAIIGGVTPGGPAWQAGIQPGGEVKQVGTLHDDQMHFREMRTAIVMAGVKSPDEPIDVSIQYDDGIRDYDLLTSSHPEEKSIRMIGITSPPSASFDKKYYAQAGSNAEKVLTPEDAGATIIQFNGKAVDTESIVPATALMNEIYTRPTEPLRLKLRRTDGTEHSVVIPPQKAKSIGLRFAVGPVVALVSGGVAEQAGMKIGDVITAVEGDESIDAFDLPIRLASITSSTQLTVRRGTGDAAETQTITISPSDALETSSPMSGIGGEIAITRMGFAYQPELDVADVSGDTDTITAGDIIKEVRLNWSDEDIPESLSDERHEMMLEALMGGWDFSAGKPLTSLNEAIQMLPEGTELTVFATRPPENKIIQATLVVRTDDDRLRFDRGLGLGPSESIQTATSFGHALSLGIREGKRRLNDVFQFLGMLVKGKVNRKQVGGPIRIVQMAGSEAERGISPQLLFLTMLSMNLAILNFLPIPALDGGHMVFLIAEAIRGRRVDEELEMRLTLAGVLALLALMAFVFFNDIVG
tara:strand:+ start:351445 stop:353559 length:2115 start_codon:yes stop_codon:yes gene_type:complete